MAIAPPYRLTSPHSYFPWSDARINSWPRRKRLQGNILFLQRGHALGKLIRENIELMEVLQQSGVGS
jgi:hypothetical protein